MEGQSYSQETTTSPQPLRGPLCVFGAGVVGDHACGLRRGLDAARDR